MREGANASLLRRNFLGSDDLYVPEVIWSHTNERVLTLERVRGIPVDDLAALDAAGIDRVRSPRKACDFSTRRCSATTSSTPMRTPATSGSIRRAPAIRVSSRSISASWARCRNEDQYWLAENFLALFNQDYRRVAELHVRAGWMPADARLDELEAAVRTVCEPYFTRPLSEISLAEVVVKLFQMARRYELTLQPQLILLQKTLLNIEGVGRLLHPRIDIWATAKPVLERIWRERHGPRAALKALRRRIPEWLAAAPDMPQLVHDYLTLATRGKLELRIASDDLKAIEQRARQQPALSCAAGRGRIAPDLGRARGAGVAVGAFGSRLALGGDRRDRRRRADACSRRAGPVEFSKTYGGNGMNMHRIAVAALAAASFAGLAACHGARTPSDAELTQLLHSERAPPNDPQAPLDAAAVDCLRAWSGDVELNAALPPSASGEAIKTSCRQRLDGWIADATRNPDKITLRGRVRAGLGAPRDGAAGRASADGHDGAASAVGERAAAVVDDVGQCGAGAGEHRPRRHERGYRRGRRARRPLPESQGCRGGRRHDAADRPLRELLRQAHRADAYAHLDAAAARRPAAGAR